MPFLDYTRLGKPISTSNKYEIRFNCPFCEDEGFHLYLNIKKKIWHCFKCNSSGKTNVVSTDLDIAHYTSVQKREVEVDIVPIKLPKPYRDPDTGDYLTSTAKKYLASRGLYESDVQRHTIYCAAPISLYFGRIIIASNPYKGYCNYFVARAYTKLKWPKYLNPSGTKELLFLSPDKPSDKWEQYWGEDELMLVEGPFDYLKASRHGPTACLLGKELKYNISKQIVSLFNKVYIMLDQGITEGIAAIKIAKILGPHVDVEVLECPRKDPGEMSPEDFEDLFNA